MTIVESNKLIADFLGKDHELNQCIAAPDFHKSWDWLKPVVDKIEQIHKGVPEELMNVNLFSTKDEVYTAVVKYIVDLLGESPSDKRKVLITRRDVYHKIAKVEIEIPLNVKNDDVADYLNENEELWVYEIDEMVKASDYEYGFGLWDGDGMDKKDQESELRYDIVNENYGGHI